MHPMQPYFRQVIGDMVNEDGESIDVANHAEMIVKFKTDHPVAKGDMLRMKK